LCTYARFNLVSLQAAVQYLRSKELAKFVDAEASDSVFHNNLPLKSLGDTIFTRHSSFFSSPSATASSADAPPYSDSGAECRTSYTSAATLTVINNCELFLLPTCGQ
jgi:hypothetical protein